MDKIYILNTTETPENKRLHFMRKLNRRSFNQTGQDRNNNNKITKNCLHSDVCNVHVSCICIGKQGQFN